MPTPRETHKNQGEPWYWQRQGDTNMDPGACVCRLNRTMQIYPRVAPEVRCRGRSPTKPIDIEKVLEGVRAIAAEKCAIKNQADTYIEEIRQLIERGRKSKDIAHKLNIDLRAVKLIRERIKLIKERIRNG